MKKSALLLPIFFFFSFALFAQSPLAEGRWWKLRIPEAGVYKLSGADLAKVGFPSDVPTSQIRVLGNEGGMLLQDNAAPRPENILEIPLWFPENISGSLADAEAFYFYADGPNGRERSLEGFRQSVNLYDDFNYVFVGYDGTSGKRIDGRATVGTPEKTFDYFDFYVFHEKEEKNLLASIRRAPGGSGRDWYGEFFDLQTSYDLPLSLPAPLRSGTTLNLEVDLVANSNSASQFFVEANGFTLGEITVQSTPQGTYSRKGTVATQNFTLNANSLSGAEAVNVSISYEKPNIDAFAFLDYVLLNGQAELNFNRTESPLFFRNVEAENYSTVGFRLSAPAGTQVWAVTTPQEVLQIGEASTGGEISFTAPGGMLEEYVAFLPENCPVPELVEEIENQNLRGLATPEYLVITHPEFQESAERLASYRESSDGLSAEVVDIFQIYNEFSSGRQDLTAIRDFVRFLYQKSPNRLKYLLLFGDTSYDPKDRTPNNTNFIPIYESRESLNPIYSHSSDDFFALMEEDEGAWLETGTDNSDLEIGVGRIPAHDAEEAAQVVDKIIAYETQEALGDWRNRVVFVADDGDNNIHQRDCENLATLIDSTYGNYNIRKIYVDAYPQIATENGKIVPEGEAEFQSNVNEGALIVNYAGHGAESGWTSEKILTTGQILKWNNSPRLPLFVTATCEFGRYDNPSTVSGGERILLQARGGGIALVTTTRPVFSSSNYVLAKAFYQMIFEPLPDGTMPRLGDAIRRTKNESLSVVNRNFALLGDPAGRLAYPQQRIVLREIQNAAGQNIQQLSALEKVQMRGQVLNGNSVDNSFNGILDVAIFDKESQRRTFGEEADSDPMDFENLENTIFKGQVSVSAGEFSIEFVVPRDINFAPGEGKISLYAQHSTEYRDASGYERMPVQGSVASAPDNSPPEIELFLENYDFQEGDQVPVNTFLLARLRDNSGINVTGQGLGHDLTAWLDGDESNAFVLNDYYTTELDDFTRGTVVFPLEGLSVGRHTLTLRAWDTHNNPAETTVEFVVKSERITFSDFVVFPNPASTEAQFRFTHSRENEDIEVLIQIFDARGALIRNIRRFYTNASGELFGLRWRGRDNSGAPVADGLYLYRLQVRSLSDNKVGQKTGKIIWRP